MYFVHTTASLYPYPNDGFMKEVYDASLVCAYCGRNTVQKSPFCIKGKFSNRFDICSIELAFDVLFCKLKVADVLRKEGVEGFETNDVYYFNGKEKLLMDEFVQLKITSQCSLGKANLAQLHKIHCPVMRVPMEGFSINPCGKEKYEFKAPLVLHGNQIQCESDIALTKEWLGSGGLAYRQPLISERFKEIYEKMHWTGILRIDENYEKRKRL